MKRSSLNILHAKLSDFPFCISSAQSWIWNLCIVEEYTAIEQHMHTFLGRGSHCVIKVVLEPIVILQSLPSSGDTDHLTLPTFNISFNCQLNTILESGHKIIGLGTQSSIFMVNWISWTLFLGYDMGEYQSWPIVRSNKNWFIW